MVEKIKPIYKVISMSDNPKKYSPRELFSYNAERHILLNDAYNLIESQQDSYLSKGKLEDSINNDEIKIYEFKGEKYLDRLDIGKVYHKPLEKKEGLTINRFFTKKGEDPLNSVEYQNFNLSIKDYETDKEVFHMDNVEVPVWMNEVSASIIAHRYFFNPDDEKWQAQLKEVIGLEHENSLKHLNKRVTDFFVEEGDKLDYFNTEEDKKAFRDELLYLQINGMGAFNSPVQFNAGLYNTYGITGSSALNYWTDYETGELKRIRNGEYIHPQLHACFIKGPNDDLESILSHGVHEGAIFASGSGIGQNIGVLREEGALLSGGGKASGPKSFTIYYDKGAGTIKSGGKTRRAARMTTMRQNHGDIKEFVEMKVKEDRKALTLIENGYSSGMDGEAYNTVALQNTNFSVMLDNDFFKALENGEKIDLIGIKDKKIKGQISANELLKKISFGSWRIGDPAVLYDSNIQEMHTSKNSGRINSPNPCGEFNNINDTSCNLLALRLTAFWDKVKGVFDVKKYKYAVKIAAIAQDIANRAASYPVPDIASISPEFGAIGQGYADIGSLLMQQGIPYDSNKGRSLAGAISALMTGTVYETSIKLAKAMGTVEHEEFNKKPMIEVMKKHEKSLDDILWKDVGDENLKEGAYQSWKNVIEQGKKYGFRNSQVTVLAPTGTTSFLMGCNTNGVEPAISLNIKKNLAGGGHVMIANEDVYIALENLSYTKEQIEDISKFIGKNRTIINAPHINPEHYKIFDTAQGVKGKGSINLEGHMKMMGAIQPFISGAISKTNNLPEKAKVKQFYDAYILGNKLKLKGIAFFRDDSKPISALGDSKDHRKLKRGEKEELPHSGDGFRQEVKIDGAPFLINIGEYIDGRPGEIVINSYTSDSTLGAMLRLAGIGASSALKRGSSLENALKGWIGHGFEPRGFVTIETPEGKIIPHPHIKQTSSPLDFVGRLALLHYKGEKEFATEPDKVNIKDLRGFTHGAFRVYQRMKVDEWNIEDVLKDPETGGFVEDSETNFSEKETNDNGKGNSNGKMCGSCGHIMYQSGPNCYECKTCGDKVGGCGA